MIFVTFNYRQVHFPRNLLSPSPEMFLGSQVIIVYSRAGETTIQLPLGFGFLASKEVRDAGAGNLGLQDRMWKLPLVRISDLIYSLNTEREALRWVRKYISSFGGDPDKVTM